VQFAHESLADHRARDLLFPALLQRSFDAVRDGFDGIDADRAFLTGALQTIDNFEPVVAFAPAVFFHHHGHHLFDTFVGGKSPAAAFAFTPSANHVAVLAQP
jgi:hypothetical protein